MNRRKILVLAIASVALILVGIWIFAIASGDSNDEAKLPYYEAGTYSEIKSILGDAQGPFVLPDEDGLSDYSYGFYRIMLNEPDGEPDGYMICGLDMPEDHYHKTIMIECQLLGEYSGITETDEVLEQYNGILLIADDEGEIRFDLDGCRYWISCDLSSSLGGFQGEEVDREEAAKMAKHIIDLALSRK